MKMPGGLRAFMVHAQRRMSSLFPGYFSGYKHNHYADFGWPEQLTFELFFQMYTRNPLAKGAVKKTARKVWKEYPKLVEYEQDHSTTDLEKELAKRFKKLRVWQKFAEAHRRAMVGRYSGIVLRFADDMDWDEEAGPVNSGLQGLVEVIPCWESQLKVSEWVTDPNAEDYGEPKMFLFNEAEIGGETTASGRTFSVHPSRVLIFSEDGTVHGRSHLEAGYNDLLTLEKIAGSGGEGFYKMSKNSPVLEIDPEADLSELAAALDTTEDKIPEKMNENIEAWQKGFDKLLFLQGIEAKQLPVNMPNPQYFREGAIENYSSSWEMPKKIMTGMQTGERASTEDAAEWNNTCMGIRTDMVIPFIESFLERMVEFMILPERDWHLKWADLTEASMGEKIERAYKMADTNDKMYRSTGQVAFLTEEIRDAVDLEPFKGNEGEITRPKGTTEEGTSEYEDGDSPEQEDT